MITALALTGIILGLGNIWLLLIISARLSVLVELAPLLLRRP